MREIKFKAWDKVLNKWNDSFLIDSENKIYKNYRDFEDGKNTFDLELLQYTGLKDKNGVEIYEGDVVQKTISADGVTSEFIAEVVFSSGGYYLKTKDGDFSFGHIDNNVLKKEVVIGNIYQNPELLA